MYSCVMGVASGSCTDPFNLGNGDVVPVINASERVTITSFGDTSQSIHFDTPSCNTLTSSPEVVFTFEVAVGVRYGYDIRVAGYDTVLQLMKGTCESKGLPDEHPEDHIVNCNDDGTPPGDMGSRITGEVDEGIDFLMVDGYSTTDSGQFDLSATFVNNGIPLCDGNFCGPDGCGGSCGSCAENEECHVSYNRCFPANCQPQCKDRECGEDGCGGSCGTCNDGLFCLGASIAPDKITGSIPMSSCEKFEICDHMNPVCEGCGNSQICASDCQCYDSLENLGDLVIVVEHMLEETFLQDVMIPESSKADISFPEPKERPDLFEYGPCHQHYHFRNFAEYTLFQSDGKKVALHGGKYAYCMEDTARHFDGVNVACDKKYDCGFQGIQKGWLDRYGWSLDCFWIDVTDLDAGDYVLEVQVNPGRVFPEISFDNNVVRIHVTIPKVSGRVSHPLKLLTSRFNASDVQEANNPNALQGAPIGSAVESSAFPHKHNGALIACILSFLLNLSLE
ncbi:hypothetical protein FisN_20Hh279 [Fistulifera solaris]|uniref:Lysyl oxidase-like protein 2/3/4 n=1 Tax=Fistulifera solaris TaxID=1519565 RepID=A0A1Z5JPV3_FISSO|nr:hypothetical protein FisN_20Hh279 [Fistulifera solaris]|eukprot:GAX16047.1 hypothetical protein FisN_20Hh279 [Fistulifera solaris]